MKRKLQQIILVLFWLFSISLTTQAAFIEPTTAPSASNQDFTQNILGANNNNNDFDSSTVVSNSDGSLIERLQYIIEAITSLWTKSGDNLYYTTGNIGIGTTTPTYGQLVVSPTAGNSATGITLNDGINATARSWIDTGDLWHLTRGSVATNGLTIDASGNVGVGTTSPAQKFSVAGIIYLGTGGFQFPDGTTQTSAATAGTTYAGGTGITLTDTVFSTTDSEIVHDNLSGFVSNEHLDWSVDQGVINLHAGNYTDTNTTYTGGTNLTLDGTTFNVDDSFLKLVGDTTGALTEDLNIDANTLVVSYDDNKVGIGTAAPSVALEVNGNIIADTPTADAHVATKAYVDAAGGGGAPYTAWGTTSCATGYTAAYTGYVTTPASMGYIGVGDGSVSVGGVFCLSGVVGTTQIGNAASGAGWAQVGHSTSRWTGKVVAQVCAVCVPD